METINHITLNTGSIFEIEENSVDKDMLFTMKRIRYDALKESGANIVDGTIFKMTEAGDCYVGTLYYDNVPLLVTAGTKYQDMNFWRMITENYKDFVSVTIPDIPPGAPYACDILLPGIEMRMDVLIWSGDFTKCIAWLELMKRK